MVINHLEKLFVTKDAGTVIKELEVEHPAAKMMVMATQMMEQEVVGGEGSKEVVGGEGSKEVVGGEGSKEVVGGEGSKVEIFYRSKSKIFESDILCTSVLTKFPRGPFSRG